ncbi:unnamed protein product [Moneuplotes crassus]|uniref:Uncharacterized protein n=1 Tax=Euplotes crassus TaxID=5936 RepID=A0AAD2DB79_EUPCR|nr:unnamed protein product [Moneuplotes crassus]
MAENKKIQDIFESCNIQDEADSPRSVNFVKVSEHNSNPFLMYKGSLKLKNPFQHTKFYQEDELFKPSLMHKEEMFDELEQCGKPRFSTQACPMDIGLSNFQNLSTKDKIRKSVHKRRMPSTLILKQLQVRKSLQ